MRRGGWVALAAAAAVVALGGSFAANEVNARRQQIEQVRALTGGGDPQAGRSALSELPCKGCHQIPGVPGAKGAVGPPLSGFAGRAYIGGRLTNQPDNLVSWIVDPHRTDPQTAMPATGVTPAQARDIAAYLYTLK